MFFVRILVFWYSSQTMLVKWDGCLSVPFRIGNGVRQGGILSPYLYAVYMNDLSLSLNSQPIGCVIGGNVLNHLMYADDMCCIAPSVKGLNRLLQKCEEYASENDIIFNPIKSACLQFYSKRFTLPSLPPVILCGKKLQFSETIKYLGVILNDKLCDDLGVKPDRFM